MPVMYQSMYARLTVKTIGMLCEWKIENIKSKTRISSQLAKDLEIATRAICVYAYAPMKLAIIFSV